MPTTVDKGEDEKRRFTRETHRKQQKYMSPAGFKWWNVQFPSPEQVRFGFGWKHVESATRMQPLSPAPTRV
jgi:hypothetical protein